MKEKEGPFVTFEDRTANAFAAKKLISHFLGRLTNSSVCLYP
jgi:hypothetical protein